MVGFLPSTAVSPASSTNNNTINDVIGNKNDNHTGGSTLDNSIYAFLKTINEHEHMPNLVYPDLATDVTLTAGAGAFTLGNFIEVVPANTITSDFDIHWLKISNPSATGKYVVYLYNGENFIGKASFTIKGTPANIIVPDIPFKTEIQVANSQIQAKIAHETGSETADIGIDYHIY